ncbi:14 kDa proline-rich protein DC2.15-like [Herrania umbratica]|uniref:14 kDa proline-rich protein DC2.15-like n=1 Tax=Herrania umbratica TaxID=108875 RepID=A0A6J1B600_9ROSI|nr:14 kDa proline-rich protein DC2.15-like [Herrania umbratica]
MASKALPAIAFLLSLNLLFLSMANANINQPKCEKNGLTLNVCANVLENFLSVRVGNPRSPCCSLIKGLVDLEADVCLCTLVDANILGLVVNLVSVSLSLLLNNCGKEVSSGFQ